MQTFGDDKGVCIRINIGSSSGLNLVEATDR